MDIMKEKLIIMRRKSILALIVFLMVFGVGVILAVRSNLMTSSDDIETVQEQYESQLMSLPGVVGVGIGDCNGKPCLKVFVEEKTPQLEGQIPTQLEGFEVDIEVTGPFEILPK
jgi:hypothetical protein